MGERKFYRYLPLERLWFFNILVRHSKTKNSLWSETEHFFHHLFWNSHKHLHFVLWNRVTVYRAYWSTPINYLVYALLPPHPPRPGLHTAAQFAIFRVLAQNRIARSKMFCIHLRFFTILSRMIKVESKLWILRKLRKIARPTIFAFIYTF